MAHEESTGGEATMKVLEITVSTQKRVKMGDGETVEHFASMKGWPESNETPDDVANRLQDPGMVLRLVQMIRALQEKTDA